MSTFVHMLESGAMLRAAGTAVWLALAAQALGVAGGLLLAPARLSSKRGLRSVAHVYLFIFRGTPELLQLVVWYAVLPLAGVNLSLTEIAIIGLSANEVARMTEIIRSGILAVDAGQHDASRALGLSRIHSAVHIVLPQATRVILPAIGNEVNVMFKNTSFVSVIGLTEILRASQLQAETSAHPLGIYFAGAVYYLLITTLWGGVQGWLEQHFDIRASRRSVWRAWWSGLTGNISTPR